MSEQQFIDMMQTLAIIANVIVLSYIVWRLEKAFNNASDKLTKVLTHEQATLDSLNKIWSRITEIENRQGIRSDLTLAAVAKRLDELEKRTK